MNEADLYIADRMLARQIALMRYTASERKRVLKIFSDMEDELKARLAKNITAIERGRAEKLLKECSAVIDQFYSEMQDNKDITALAQDEIEASEKIITAIGIDGTLPAPQTVKALTSNTLLYGAPLKDWWAKQAEETAFKFAAQVRQGIAQGESLQQIIYRIIGNKRQGTAGIMDIARRHASTLVHDSIMKVTNDARTAFYQENDDVIRGMMQLSTLDSHTTPICIAYSGAKWDLTGNPIEGNTLPYNGGCPRHPNCRSIIIPIMRSMKELTGLNIPEKKTGTRASDLGQIKADITFERFLNMHNDEYVNKLLGVGKADLWRKGKITLQQLVDQTGRPLTLKELKDAA